MAITRTNNKNKKQNHRPYLMDYDAGLNWFNTPVIIITKKGLIDNYSNRQPIKKINYFSEAFLTYYLSQPSKPPLQKVEYSIEKTLQVFEDFFAASITNNAIERVLFGPTYHWGMQLRKYIDFGSDSLTGLCYILETLEFFKFNIPGLQPAVIDGIMEDIFNNARQTGYLNRFFSEINRPLKALKILIENQKFKKDVLIPFWIKALESLIYDWYMHIKNYGQGSKTGVDGIEINLDGLMDLVKVNKLVGMIFKRHFGFKNVQVQ